MRSADEITAEIEWQALDEIAEGLRRATQAEAVSIAAEVLRCREAAAALRARPTARPLDEYHEDYGPVLWWKFPIEEPPHCGMPLDSDWPGYHTHWTPLPPLPDCPDLGYGTGDGR